MPDFLINIFSEKTEYKLPITAYSSEEKSKNGATP